MALENEKPGEKEATSNQQRGPTGPKYACLHPPAFESSPIQEKQKNLGAASPGSCRSKATRTHCTSKTRGPRAEREELGEGSKNQPLPVSVFISQAHRA